MSDHMAGRPAIPDDNAPVSPAHRPTWWTVRTVRSIAFVCVGLAVALSLVSTLVSWRSAQAANVRAVEVEQRLAALEDFVEGRGEYRDREAERLQREIRDGICDLLDQFPGSALLDVPRAKYGCGPGAVPPPGAAPPVAPSVGAAPEQSRAAPSVATPARPPTEPQQAPASGPPPAPATPTAPPGRPLTGPPAADPAEPAPPPRGLGLEPVTDPLCAVLGVCL